jgi:predicted CXXCH cytochrome family protein
MLVEDYPAVFYAPFKPENFALCFKCHIPDLVVNQSGRGLTNFRNGEKNLHFVHVNQAKGRTCRACHEVHASKRPFHIREAVPFGASGWELEINYQRSEEGGSCSPGCHKTRSYSRSGATPTLQMMNATGAGK